MAARERGWSLSPKCRATRSQYGRYVVEGITARLQVYLTDGRSLGEQYLSPLQTRGDADRNVLHAAACDRTNVQLLLDAEEQNRQFDELVITALRSHVSHHSFLVNSARAFHYSDIFYAYETCLQALLSEVAGRIRDCRPMYHSDVETQLGAYESTIQQVVHSILTSPDPSLE